MTVSVVIIAWILVVVIVDMIVFSYIGRWSLPNLLSPTRFFLLLVVVLIQIPAGFTMHHPRLAAYSAGTIHGLFACALAPLFLVLGSVLAGRRHISFGEWWESPTVDIPRWTTIVKGLAILIPVGIILQIVIVGGPGNVPLVANILHPGQAAVLRDLREEALKFQPLYIRYTVTYLRYFCTFIPVVGFVLLRHHRMVGRASFFTVLILGVINAGMQGAKDPPAAVILVALFAWLLVKAKKLRLRYVVGGMLIGSLFPLMFTLARLEGMSTDNVKDAYGRLGNRLFAAPSLMVLQYFAYVPEVSGQYYYGRTIQLVAFATNQEYVPLPNVVSMEFEGKSFRSSFANAAFFADAWSNFGWPGVIISCVLVGLFLGMSETLILRCSKNVMTVGVLLATVISCRVMASIPATSFLLGDGGMVLLMLAFMCRSYEMRLASEFPVESIDPAIDWIPPDVPDTPQVQQGGQFESKPQ